MSRRTRNPLLKPGVRPGFQLNSRFSARPAGRANFPFSVHGLAEQVGHSLTGKYPTGVFSKSVRLMKTVPNGDGFLFAASAAARSPFMTWPSKSATALWENAPPGHFLIPQGELRTADVYRPALPVVLGLRCECQLYGTTASQVPVLCSMGAQCGSTTCFCGAHLRVRRREQSKTLSASQIWCCL